MTFRPYRFRFRSVWRLPAQAARVYAVLERPETYPSWWPQVRGLHETSERAGTARFRSVLPFDLVVTLDAARQDPDARVLEVRMTGDLEGWARWTVAPDPSSGERGCERGALALFEQQVEVRKPLMRLLAVPGRPFFRANHALMMRAGQRGLRRWLARGLDES